MVGEESLGWVGQLGCFREGVREVSLREDGITEA